MPFISDSTAARLQERFDSMNRKLKKARADRKQRTGIRQVVGPLEVIGTAAIMGYARGQMEGRGKKFAIGDFSLDMILGLGLTGISFFGLFGKYDEDVTNLGTGALSSFTAFAMRDMGFKAGQQGRFFGDEYGVRLGSRHNRAGMRLGAHDDVGLRLGEGFGVRLGQEGMTESELVDALRSY